MKALIYEGPKQMVLREVDRPELGPDEVLVQVAVSGICGSELSGFLGQSSLRKPPLIFGHEFSGVIVDAGRQADRYAMGTRVTANPLLSCGHCVYCQASHEQRCLNRKLLGAALPGSNATYVAVAESAIVPLPPELSLDQAALAEPIAYALHVADLTSATPDASAAVFGMGPIGLFIIQTLKNAGYQAVYAIDTNRARLALADALGATATLNPSDRDPVEDLRHRTQGRGVDLAVDAVGSTVTRQGCVFSVQRGGTVIFSGLHASETALPINDMVRDEITVHGAFAYTHRQFRQAVDLLASGRVGLEPSWIAKAPLDEGSRWYQQLLADPGGIAKVLLVP